MRISRYAFNGNVFVKSLVRRTKKRVKIIIYRKKNKLFYPWNRVYYYGFRNCTPITSRSYIHVYIIFFLNLLLNRFYYHVVISFCFNYYKTKKKYVNHKYLFKRHCSTMGVGNYNYSSDAVAWYRAMAWT